MFEKVKLVLAWGRLRKQIRKERAMGFDFSLGIRKFIKGVVEGALAVALPGLLAYLTDAEALKAVALASGFSEALAVTVVAVLVGLLRFGSNYLKHR